MAREQNGVLSLLLKSSVNQTRASLQVVPSEEVVWERGWGQCWGHHGGPAVERGPSEPQRSPLQHVHSRHTRGGTGSHAGDSCSWGGKPTSAKAPVSRLLGHLPRAEPSAAGEHWLPQLWQSRKAVREPAMARGRCQGCA